RPIIRTEGDSPRHITVELSLDAPFRSLLREPGAGPRGDALAVLPIPLAPQGIAHGVPLLDNGRAAGVLEVVGPLLLHERVLDTAKIDPEVRELMDEERRREEEIDVVEILPLIAPGPCAVARLGQRVRGRAQAEDVEEHRLTVSLPAVAQETGPGLPSHGHDGAVGGGPGPIDPLVEESGELPYLAFVIRRG